MTELATRFHKAPKDTKPSFISDVAVDFSTTSSVLILYDRAVIDNMITHLFATTVGERGAMFEPTFGSRIPYFLHEPVNATTAWKMETEIFESIRRWIPYITLITSQVRVDVDPDAGIYYLTVPYRITLPTYYNQVFTYATIIQSLQK